MGGLDPSFTMHYPESQHQVMVLLYQQVPLVVLHTKTLQIIKSHGISNHDSGYDQHSNINTPKSRPCKFPTSKCSCWSKNFTVE